MKKTLTLVLTVLLVGSVWAAPVNVVNYSFETGQFPGWPFRPPVAGKVAGGIANLAWAIPTDGNAVLYINNGTVYQDPVTNVLDNMVYTLNVDVGGRANANAGYLVKLIKVVPFVGETVLTQQIGTAYTADPATLNVPVQLQWVSTISDTGAWIRIELGMDGSLQPLFDNVRLDATPIPEPAIFMLLGLVGIVLLKIRK